MQRPPQYQQPYPPQQYPQQQYGQQQYPQSPYMRPKTNTAAWILGVMCIVFFAGFITMMIYYINSNPRAEGEADRANKAEAALVEAKARITSLEHLTGNGNAAIGKEQVERMLASEKKRADRYWRLLSTEKQQEFLAGEMLHVDDVQVDHGGHMAHVTLSNRSDQTMLNVEVRLLFWEHDKLAYVQPENIASIPPRTKEAPYKHTYDIVITRDNLDPHWIADADAESGGTARVKTID
jgi:hypothetical protein